MRENHLRTALESDRPSLCTRVISPWPGMLEVIGQTDLFDYVEFAAEYGPFDLHDLDHLGRTAELADLAAMIKLDAEPRTFLAQRAMAAGIQNTLFADVRSVADAEEAVAAVRPPPDGKNGVRMDRRSGYVGGYASIEEVVEWCEDAVVAIMVEKASTVENLDDILAVDGIDMVQFGSADYSLSIDKAGQRDDPEVTAAERKTIETALDRGIAPRVELSHPEQAEPYLEMGVRDFSIGTDVRIVYRWLQNQAGALADTLETSAR